MPDTDAMDERAKIVAWLREFGNHPPAPNCERCNAADAIERGEHDRHYVANAPMRRLMSALAIACVIVCGEGSARALGREVPPLASHQVTAYLRKATVSDKELFERGEMPPSEHVAVGYDSGKHQFKVAIYDAEIGVTVQGALAVVHVDRIIARTNHVRRLIERVLWLVNLQHTGLVQRSGHDRPHAHIVGRGLPAIEKLQLHSGWTVAPKTYHFMIFGHEICPKLALSRSLRNLVSLPGFSQRPLSLAEGEYYKDQASERQDAPDAAKKIVPPSKTRRFFSREGGAPLGAQIGGVVIFGLIAFIGLYVGIGRIIRSHSGGWAWLTGGLLAYGLFLWWSSPT